MRYILSLLLLTMSTSTFAQDVDVDKKTGLVTVDGTEAFYLTPKNKGIMSSDFALENLDHKELAYLKYTEGTKYTNNGTATTTMYHMVFTESGNQCMLTDFSLLTGVMKPLAKRIVAASLVKDGAVSQMEERKFVTLNRGSFVRDAANSTSTNAAASRVQASDAPRSAAGPADISLKDPNIYNNSELVGMYKRTVDAGVTTISIYNASDALVAKASHPDGDENADWTIVADGKTATILYNPAAPLEKLFKYLVEKGYL